MDIAGKSTSVVDLMSTPSARAQRQSSAFARLIVPAWAAGALSRCWTFSMCCSGPCPGLTSDRWWSALTPGGGGTPGVAAVVGVSQAVVVLACYAASFVLVTGILLTRRDVV
jgi:hypothetical protein